MTPQELKNSILQLAIQGKLVEQRPEEGTGEELYRQIQAEKQKLIREGKIKKKSLCRRLQRMKFRLTFRRAGSGFCLKTWYANQLSGAKPRHMPSRGEYWFLLKNAIQKKASSIYRSPCIWTKQG